MAPERHKDVYRQGTRMSTCRAKRCLKAGPKYLYMPGTACLQARHKDIYRHGPSMCTCQAQGYLQARPKYMYMAQRCLQAEPMYMYMPGIRVSTDRAKVCVQSRYKDVYRPGI